MTVTILDGGMGKELRRIGAPFRQPEWSALALMESPDHVVQAHRNFIEAGAEVITTNNYAVVPFHLEDEVFDARGRELIDLAGRLAREAAATADRTVRIAGSMPPLFGSYEPDRFDAQAAAPLYAMLASALEPHVDLWIAETLSTCAEVDTIVAAIERVDRDRPIWIGFSFPDEWGTAGVALRSDEDADAIAATIARHDRIEAVLVNCTRPEQTGPAHAALRAALDATGADVRTGAYANAFPIDDDAGYRANNKIYERREDLTPERYADFVASWIDDGATIVGGCCDMYPPHIAALAERFGLEH